jgi:hypothetical protein
MGLVPVTKCIRKGTHQLCNRVHKRLAPETYTDLSNHIHLVKQVTKTKYY